MNYFCLKEGEEVGVSYQDILIKANDNKYSVTLILTTERLVLLRNVNTELTMNQFLQTRGIQVPSNYEVVFDISKKDIKEVTYKSGMNLILFHHNSNSLSLYCDSLEKYFN